MDKYFHLASQDYSKSGQIFLIQQLLTSALITLTVCRWRTAKYQTEVHKKRGKKDLWISHVGPNEARDRSDFRVVWELGLWLFIWEKNICSWSKIFAQN